MVLRTARKGRHAGEQFYGCSRYPRCRGIVPLSTARPQPHPIVVSEKHKEATGFWADFKVKLAEIPLTDKQVNTLDGWSGYLCAVPGLGVGLPVGLLTHNWGIGALSGGGTWYVSYLMAQMLFLEPVKEGRQEKQRRERQPELERQAKEQFERQQAEALEQEKRQKAEALQREERERLERERRRTLERQQREVGRLIDAALGIVQSGISSSTHGDDSLLLGALLILRQQLEDCRAQFDHAELSYEAAKARVGELREQAEVLISPAPSGEMEQVNTGETHYAVLGVDRTASQDEIKRAYREKMRRLHPDTMAAWAKGEVPQEVKDFLNEKTKKLNLAYQLLSDPKKRRDYDASIERRTPDG